MNDASQDHLVSRPRARLRRWPLVAVAALALAALAAWIGVRAFGDDEAAALATVTLEIGDVERTVTAVGSLEPKEYVDVGTQVSGQLQKLYVDIGDRVHQGDLIAEIDPTRYESQVRSDRANLDNLRAQLQRQQAELELARLQLARNERMAAISAVSRDTVDQLAAAAKIAAANVAATQAQIKAAEASLEGDLANLGYTKIYAPLDGTVVSQTTREGQTVNANQSTPVIVQVANLDIMTVWAQVTEADINKIEPGMKAYFTTLGMPERRWTGIVRQIQPTPEVVNDVVLYNVLIDVENEQRLLLPQMTVQVFFVLAEAHDVPLVPMTALRPRPQAGPDAFEATVLTPDGPQTRPVRVGVTSRLMAEVASGLAAGDRVVVQEAAADGGRGRVPRMMGPRL